MAKKKENSKDEEEVCETFEVEEKGKEKVVTSCGQEPVKHASKEQIKNQEKILRNFFIIVGVVVLFCVGVYFSSYFMANFQHNEIEYEIVNEGDLIFYKTGFPTKGGGNKMIYNFYIRNDPRKLEDVEFKGEMFFVENLVLNMSENISCDGDDIIAIANLVKLYEFVGTKVMKDPNASCDDLGRYAYVNIQEGNETRIDRTGKACYELTFKDCEILEVTERLMIEIFSEVNQNVAK